MSQKSILKSPEASKKMLQVSFLDQAIRRYTFSSLPFFHYSKAQVSEVQSVIQTAKSQVCLYLQDKKFKSQQVLSLRVKSLEMTLQKEKRALSCIDTSNFSDYLNKKKIEKCNDDEGPKYIRVKEVKILKDKRKGSTSPKRSKPYKLIQKLRRLKSN